MKNLSKSMVYFPGSIESNVLKKASLLLFFLSMLYVSSQAQNVTIPDANFKAALLANTSINTIDDGEISVVEAQAFTGVIQVSNLEISDLTGIEAFTAITSLKCSQNSLITLDVSQNTALETLSCTLNQLTSLNISQNLSLKVLACQLNQITSLDLSQNIVLEELSVWDNMLTSLDVSANTALTSLNCGSNDLGTLDVSNNVLLESLTCNDIGVSTLDVSNLTALKDFQPFGNMLTSLDVSQNIELTRFRCFDNNLTSLDISQNTKLNWLGCYQNNLTTIDVSNNPLIERFWIHLNQLTAIDVNNLSELENLSCSHNEITSLDLGQNSKLRELYAHVNEITSLDLSANPDLLRIRCSSNQLTDLNIANGNNTSLTEFFASDNPNLMCIKVDDVAYAEANLTDIDASAEYKLICDPNEIISIPEANFKAALLAHDPVIDTNDDDEISFGEAEAFTEAMNIISKNISDLSGIEYFTNLSELNANSNQLVSVDISQNTSLTKINLPFNDLTELDVTKNTALTFLRADDNELTAIDVSQNTLLESFIIGDNDIDVLDVSTLINLTELKASSMNLSAIDLSENTLLNVLQLLGNNLTSLDVSNNSALIEINVGNNDIADISLNNPSLVTLRLANNDLSTLDLSSLTSLELIEATGNSLPETGLDFSNNPSITNIIMIYSGLTSIDVSDLSNLTSLFLTGNSLSQIDLSNNSLLEILHLPENNLSAIDLSTNTSLVQLGLADNRFTDLDISDLADLTYFKVDENDLRTLNISNGANASLTTFNVLDNPNLTCIQVDDVAFAEANFTDIDEGVNFVVGECPITFPDANFKAALVAHSPVIDTNDDGEIQVSEAEAFTGTMQVILADVSDVSGLEYFINLETLFLNSNASLSTIDVSSNTALEHLEFANCDVSEIDLSNNLALRFLRAGNNNLSSLDLSNNAALIEINVNDNNLSALDVTSCPDLQTLLIRQNSLTAIHVGDNLNLKTLNADNNSIESLDLLNNQQLTSVSLFRNSLKEIQLPSNSDMETLVAPENQLSSIDVSVLESLTELRIHENQLTGLDISSNEFLTVLSAGGDNDLRYVNAANGSNASFTTFNFTNSPNLTCIQVDDASYAEANFTDVDDASVFTDVECTIDFPDANFKAALVAHDPVIDTNSDGEIQYSEAEALTGRLSVTTRGIEDLTGLQYFSNITQLAASNNQLTSVDLSQNPKLTLVWLTHQDLESIDVSMLPDLENLAVTQNNLTSLDLSNNPKLTMLECYNNSLNSLDVSSLPLLGRIYAQNTGLSTIDVSANPALTQLNLNDNSLSSIDVSNNPELLFLALTSNELIEIDLNANVKLTELSISDNDISSVDVSNQVVLREFYARDNMLSQLDLSNNVALKKIAIYNNPLISVNLKNGTNTIISSFNASGTPDLTCLQVDDVAFAEANFTAIDEQVSFSTDCAQDAIDAGQLIFDCVEATDIESASLSTSSLIGTNDGPVDFTIGSVLLYKTKEGRTGKMLVTGFDESNNLSLMFDWVTYTEEGSVFSSGSLNGTFRINLSTGTFGSDFSEADFTWSRNTSTRSSLGPANGAVFSVYNGIVEIPDANFKAALLDYDPVIDTNDDGEIQLCEAKAVTGTINVNSKEIASLAGIASFTELTRLEADVNEITEVDLSSNEKLTLVRLSSNNLAALDVSSNTALTELSAAGNTIEVIDLSANADLRILNLTSNSLESLDLSDIRLLNNLSIASNELTSVTFGDQSNLSKLSMGQNAFTSFDFSGLTSLTSLQVAGNMLTTLDIPNSPNLSVIDAGSNAFTSLDFSGNVALERLYLIGNELLHELDLRNGQNASLVDFSATGNPNLICILVDDVAHFETNFSTRIDSHSSYLTECLSEETDITAFSLAEQTGNAVIDLENHTVAIEVEVGTDFTALTPTISVSDGATISPTGVQDLTDGFTYTVTAENGVTMQEWVVSVSRFNTAPTTNASFNDFATINGFGMSDRNFATAYTDAEGDEITLTTSSSDESVVTSEFVGDIFRINEVGIGTATITVTADDGFGGVIINSFDFTVEFVAQAAPTAIALSNVTIDENAPVNTLVGQLSRTDVNTFDEAVYTLVAGEGDTDNDSFTVSLFELKSNEVFDFDTKSSYSVRVQVDDLKGGTLEQVFTITINDLGDNAVPTVTTFEDVTREEGFESLKLDLAEHFSDSDNDALTFEVTSSNTSVVTTAFDPQEFVVFTEVGIGSATITMSANDGNGGTVSGEFTFTVAEKPNTAPEVTDPLADISEDEGFEDVVVDLNGVFTDVDNDALTYTVSSSDETVVTAEIDAGNLVNVKEKGIGTSTITVTADDGNGGTVSDEFTVTVSEIPNVVPVVANPLADIVEEEGFEFVVVNLNGVFTDADNDDLTFTITSSDETVVTAEMDAGNLVNIEEKGIGTSTITVTAGDGNGGTVSDKFTVTVNEAPLSIRESFDISIYPNPVVEVLKVQSKKKLSVQLINAEGKVLLKEEGNNLSFDMRSLQPSVYMIVLDDGNSITQKRIIKLN